MQTDFILKRTGVHVDNRETESTSLLAEQALQCLTQRVSLVLVFPEDFWLAGADQMRLLVLLHFGHELYDDRPLTRCCSCPTAHKPMKGLTNIEFVVVTSAGFRILVVLLLCGEKVVLCRGQGSLFRLWFWRSLSRFSLREYTGCLLVDRVLTERSSLLSGCSFCSLSVVAPGWFSQWALGGSDLGASCWFSWFTPYFNEYQVTDTSRIEIWFHFSRGDLMTTYGPVRRLVLTTASCASDRSKCSSLCNHVVSRV